MYRRLCVLLVTVSVLMSGCWDRNEVNDLAIVTMVGVDASPKGVRLSVNVAVPPRIQGAVGSSGGGGAQGGDASITYTAEGGTILEASRLVQEKVSRRLFWAHARVLVIGAAFAREGVRPALDFWTRHREPRMLMNVVVTEGRAEDMLLQRPRLERLLAEAVRETVNLQLQARTTFLDFVQSLRNKAEGAVAPVVAISPTEGQANDVMVSGTAVFQGDRLVGFVDDRLTRGVLWLRDEIQQGISTFELPTGGRVSLQIVRATTDVRPRLVKGKLRLEVHTVSEADLHETSGKIDVSKPETLTALEKLAVQDVRLLLEETLDEVQKGHGVDVLRFGDAVRRGLPLVWEGGLKDRWAEEFPTVPVDLFVDVYIRRTGEHGAPLGIDPEEIKQGQQELMKR